MSYMQQGQTAYPQQQHQQYPPAYGYVPPRGWGRPSYPIETKPFYLTSEFVGSVLAVAGIAITAAASDAFGAWRAWILISAITIGYMVSRGIAKSGTRSNASDPREELTMNRDRGGSSRDERRHEHRREEEDESGPWFG
jgi:hypothetical protein